MTGTTERVGAVLVVGGGVGGMQASLDLAEAGYKVYLVEEATSIGGKMAQLDKTFPTNDCAMCTLAPRLVDTGAHLNIEKLTGATVERLRGEPGHLEVDLSLEARYVDLACTGCSLCVEKCPVRLDSEFDEGLVKRTAISRRYPQAFPGALAIDKQGVSPCRTSCPAGVNAHAYVSLVAQGRYAEALEVERQGNPFPAMIGRVCTHPCELDCSRAALDGGVGIRPLKRFLSDWEAADPARRPPTPRVAEKRSEKVAVVGSGPAGLMAARELALRGYPVTLFEAQDEPGGMLRYAIPAFRLPKEIVAREIKEAVLDLGVELRTRARLGVDFTLDDLRRQHRAVILAIGAWQGARLDIPGEKGLQGVVDAVPFLTDVNSGRPPDLAGKKVLVIGGGNSATDAARSALRLGAEVMILYRRTRAEMPAYSWEVDEALEEGAAISFLVAPSRVIGEQGRVTGLECTRMQPRRAGRLGAPAPRPHPRLRDHHPGRRRHRRRRPAAGHQRPRQRGHRHPARRGHRRPPDAGDVDPGRLRLRGPGGGAGHRGGRGGGGPDRGHLRRPLAALRGRQGQPGATPAARRRSGHWPGWRRGGGPPCASCRWPSGGPRSRRSSSASARRRRAPRRPGASPAAAAASACSAWRPARRGSSTTRWHRRRSGPSRSGR